VAGGALRCVILLTFRMKTKIALRETLQGQIRQIGCQIIGGLKRLDGSVSEGQLHARTMAFTDGEIPDFFAQVFETLSGERRHGRKRIAGATLSVASNTAALIGCFAARLCRRSSLSVSRGRLTAGRPRGQCRDQT